MINLVFILIGIFLRQYNISNNYYFSGELGKELLYTASLIEKGVFPTIGMATSHEWLSYGPIYYWILIPIVKIFSFNPLTLFWLSFVVSIVGLLLNYFLIKKITNKNIAMYSTVLISLSPIFIWFTRASKLHAFFFILTPILIFLMKMVWDRKSQFVFWLGLVFGIFFSFHFSQIPLIVVILAILLIKKYKLKDFLILTLGILIPNLGIILKDLKLLLWLPYRSLGLSAESSSQTLNNFNQFFGMQFFWDERFWIIGSLISISIIYIFFRKFFKAVDKNFFNFYLLFSSVIVFGGLILHKNPPIHYFFPILPNIFFMLAIIMDKYLNRVWIFTVFLLLSFFSFWKFDYSKGIDYIPYKKQLEISQSIVNDNKNILIKIKRIGPYDYFPENYSQNYKFLVWYLGGKQDEKNGREIIINDNENINTK